MTAEFKRPEYPELLLSRTWDKKKSLAAKSKVKDTGVGDAMDDAQKSWGNVDWAKLEGLNECSWATFNLPDWNKALEQAKSEATGALRKFQLALDKVRDSAKAAEKRLAEQKLAADVKLAHDIAAQADALAGRMHANVVLPVLIAAHRDNKAPYENIVKSTNKTIQGTVGNVLKAMLEVKNANYDPKVFNANVLKVRDVAQALGNVQNYIAKGFDVGISASDAQKMYKEMMGWRNGNPQFPPDTPAQTVNLEVYKIRDSMARALMAFK